MFNEPNTPNRQRGSVLIVALFVILVLALLAANLTRINWSNQDTLTREQLGNQAWFLAHSSNEWAIAQLFPLQSPTDSLTDICTSITDQDIGPELIGNSNLACSTVDTDCEYFAGSGGDYPEQLRYIKVTSNAICSSGKHQVERVQEVWVKGEPSD